MNKRQAIAKILPAALWVTCDHDARNDNCSMCAPFWGSFPHCTSCVQDAIIHGQFGDYPNDDAGKPRRLIVRKADGHARKSALCKGCGASYSMECPDGR